MGRFLMLVGVAAVAAAMYVAAPSASQTSRGPTAKQFSALKKQVAGLSKQVKTLDGTVGGVIGLLSVCMQGAVPINQFGDPNGSLGYVFDTDGKGTLVDTSALDITASTDTGALWITGSTGTGCESALGSPALHRAAAKAGVAFPHFTLPSAFAAHRH